MRLASPEAERGCGLLQRKTERRAEDGGRVDNGTVHPLPRTPLFPLETLRQAYWHKSMEYGFFFHPPATLPLDTLLAKSETEQG